MSAAFLKKYKNYRGVFMDVCVFVCIYHLILKVYGLWDTRNAFVLSILLLQYNALNKFSTEKLHFSLNEKCIRVFICLSSS